MASTGLETLLGDPAVAAHPEDARYSALLGKTLSHTLFAERKIAVIADAAVGKEFGTGAVKVTPAHEPTDFEIGRRHDDEV